MSGETALYAVQGLVIAGWLTMKIMTYVRRRRARWMINGVEVKTVDDSGEGA